MRNPDEVRREFFPGERKLLWSDLLVALCLLLAALAFNLPGLGHLQFYRHTEADRTLIGWEMYRRGEYIVPHLLGAEILTKPPLFYWIVAASIAFFGSASEWVARFPSALFGALLVAGQYLFVRRATGSRRTGLLAALFTGTGSVYITLTSVAEIDMTFGSLCSFVFFFLYFSLQSLPATVAVYVFAAVAFLAKGPPIIAFVATSFPLYALVAYYTGETFSLKKLLRNHILGALLFASIVAVWLFALASEVGWQELGRQFRIEILERVFHPSTHHRGPLFYFGALFTSLLPWSFLIPSAFRPLKELSPSYKRFFLFQLCVVVPALFLLSMAEGKSTRYIFPVYAAAINLAVCGISLLPKFPIWLSSSGAIASFITAVALFITPSFLSLPGVEPRTTQLVGSLFGLSLLIMSIGFHRRRSEVFLASLFFAAFAVRVGERTVYAANRNETRGSSDLARQVHEIVPPGEPVYTLEMFERWVVFYLLHHGRDVYRMTPAIADELESPAYVLLSYDEEYWRKLQLHFSDPGFEVLADLTQAKQHLLLVKITPTGALYLAPHESFPTVPSEPFYWERETLLGKKEKE